MSRVGTKNDLIRRGLRLEHATLVWNVVGVPVLAVAALRSGSAAAAGFGLDSLIEIGASTVVIWQLSGATRDREAKALRWIGWAFVAVAAYVLGQAAYTFASGNHPHSSVPGIVWTAMTVVVMLGLARGKHITGRALQNPVLQAEGRVTLIDAVLAAAVLLGLGLNAAVGWWWADPVAGLVIVGYALAEARHTLA
ncbi:MAG: cation transporter [Actinomycetia bacterium]|nr:cation transporter [Actinomycetes bacterium]